MEGEECAIVFETEVLVHRFTFQRPVILLFLEIRSTFDSVDEFAL